MPPNSSSYIHFGNGGSAGRERAGTRAPGPAITVTPVTSNVERAYPFQLLLPSTETGLDHDSEARAEQVRSIAAKRVGDWLRVVPHAILLDIDKALRLHLGL